MKAAFENVKGIFKEVVDVMNDEGDAHLAIRRLVKQSKTLLEQERDNMPEPAIAAATQMHYQLEMLLTKNGKNLSNDPWTEYQLLEQAIIIVSHYEKDLEVCPGFFNKFKSYVNDFVELFTGVKDLFYVEKTAFSYDENNMYMIEKNQVIGMRNDMECNESKYTP